ncbi:hypothetical protein QR680_009932 [Steinernema hermaphroditum]|uniref:Uncharacterized protein n=1 Tax=Steinernema hermaphroditum TaxID=289476 RepID=A0AA39IM53_9BILA|nr:hypothetical protein QR680_009932 [Steinernema hermaphroditum]
MISDELLDVLRRAVAVFEILQLPICIPFYVALIWIFATKPDFKNVIAYKILINMCIMDCLYLTQSFMDGVFRLSGGKPNRHLGSFLSSTRCSYLQSVPFLTLVLASHRSLVMFRIDRPVLQKTICLAAVFICWLLLFPAPLIFDYSSLEIGFFLDQDGYGYYGPEPFLIVMGYLGPSFQAGAFLCYMCILGNVLIKKYVYGSAFKVSAMDIRLLVQAFLISVPLAVVIVCGLVLCEEFSELPWFYIGWSCLAALIPAINLVVHIAFNPLVRSHIWNVCSSKRTTASAVIVKSTKIYVTPVQTFSECKDKR